MIFNVPLGGLSYINVTAPVGSSVSATYLDLTVRGSNSCILEAPIIGNWLVSCTYDNITESTIVNVETFGVHYIVDFVSTFSVTIVISCPAGASILAYMEDYSETFERVGPGSITVHKTGEWKIKCTYDGVELTHSVQADAYGESYSVEEFVYSCTIVVTTQIGAYVTISKSGYSSDSKTADSNGNATFTVSKNGDWNVTSEFARGTNGATSKSGTVSAVYGESKPIGVYPRIYLYKLDTGSGYYVTSFGLHVLDANPPKNNDVQFNHSYGAWKDLLYWSTDSGNNVLTTVNAIKLNGYTKMYARGRYLDAWSIIWGFHNPANNIYSVDQWTPKVTIKAGGSRESVTTFQNWQFTFSLSGKYFPVMRNINGSSESSADVEIHEWYIE